MPEYRYKKQKNKVSKFYRGDEMLQLVREALGKYEGRDEGKVSRKKAQDFLRGIPGMGPWGEVVVVLENPPLNSMAAQGKIGKEVFCIRKKTGTQYVKKYSKGKNPRTKAQQAQRKRFGKASRGWRQLSETVREKYRIKTKDMKMTGYNLFCKEKFNRE